VTTGQMEEVAARYLARYPQDLHMHIGTLLARAFQEAWPCPKR
jgi:hypothetical protein